MFRFLLTLPFRVCTVRVPMARIEQPNNDLGTALKRARKAARYSNAKNFLAAVKEAQGSAPSYSTYAQWESGEVQPRDESLAPIEAFHRERGTWVEPAGAPDLASALLALAGELAALREERHAMVRRVDELEAQVAELVLAAPSASETRAPGGHGAPALSAR